MIPTPFALVVISCLPIYRVSFEKSIICERSISDRVSFLSRAQTDDNDNECCCPEGNQNNKILRQIPSSLPLSNVDTAPDNSHRVKSKLSREAKRKMLASEGRSRATAVCENSVARRCVQLERKTEPEKNP